MRSPWYTGTFAVASLALAAGCGSSRTDVGDAVAPGGRPVVAKAPEGAAFDPDRASLEDAIYEFQCAYISAKPFFNLKEGERYSYRTCEALAIDMEYFAQIVAEKHLKEFMPVGPAFHRDVKFIARHAHDLSVSCAEHRPEDIKKSWERMVATVERALPPKVSLDGTVARPVVFGERCRGLEPDPFGEVMAEDASKGGGKEGDAVGKAGDNLGGNTGDAPKKQEEEKKPKDGE